MATAAPNIGQEITGEQAALESVAETRNFISHMSGTQKVAALLLALGSEWGQPIWNEMNDDEVIAISVAMSDLGNIGNDVTQAVLSEFISQMSLAGALLGTA